MMVVQHVDIYVFQRSDANRNMLYQRLLSSSSLQHPCKSKTITDGIPLSFLPSLSGVASLGYHMLPHVSEVTHPLS